MKFGVVGVLAFALDYGLLAFFTEVLGIDYLISATASYIISTVFNYLASMRFVFRHRENMSRTREFVIFFIGSLIGLGINDGCMWLGVELLGVHYLITKLFATVVVAIWNFVTRKIFLDADREKLEF
ncbi:MAG: GtrA family protein [Eggerthellaceae bacterium]|nr:GtrA family protein [Eggerthellaceae bacterium]